MSIVHVTPQVCIFGFVHKGRPRFSTTQCTSPFILSKCWINFWSPIFAHFPANFKSPVKFWGSSHHCSTLSIRVSKGLHTSSKMHMAKHHFLSVCNHLVKHSSHCWRNALCAQLVQADCRLLIDQRSCFCKMRWQKHHKAFLPTWHRG